MNLDRNIFVKLIQVPLAAGVTDPDSLSINMSDFDGVLFVGTIGLVTAGGVNIMTAQKSTDDVSFSNFSGVSVTAPANSTNKIMVIDMYKPLFQFIRLVWTRNVANSVISGIVAYAYQGTKRPEVNDSSVVVQNLFVGSS